MQKVFGGRVVLQNLPNYMDKHFIKGKKKKNHWHRLNKKLKFLNLRNLLRSTYGK